MKVKLVLLKKAKERIEKKEKERQERQEKKKEKQEKKERKEQEKQEKKQEKKEKEEVTKDKTKKGSKIKNKKSQLQTYVRSIKDQYKTMPQDIRWMCQVDGLCIHKKKNVLTESIQKHEKRVQHAVRIQALVRGHFVRLLWHISSKQRFRDCINDTDFYTLETFAEFPTEHLYCCAPADGQENIEQSSEYLHTKTKPREYSKQIYGFNICSLITLFIKNKNMHPHKVTPLLNPYTRDVLNTAPIIQAYYLTRIVYKNTQNMPTYPGKPTLWDFIPPMPTVEPQGRDMQGVTRLSLIDMAENGSFTEPQQHILYNLAFLETLPMHRRMIELFIDFDLFGNYTNVHWFQQLDWFRLRRFYYNLRTAWNQLPHETRQSICIIGNPYDIVQINISSYIITEEEFRVASIMIMEMLTYCGNTYEDQRLGVFQILVALCSVSQEARRVLNHLL